MKKMAIVSTFDELCGIAGYTKALLPHLEKNFLVNVYNLDQFILRSSSKKMKNLGDLEIKNML